MVRVLKKNYSNEDIYLTLKKQNEIMKLRVNPENYGWSQRYGDKVFFSFILITTVGYGNVAPRSKLAQIICIFYTLFGMPLHVVLMRLLSFKFRGGLRRTFKLVQRFKPNSNSLLGFSGILFFLFWLTVFFFVPSYLFMLTDAWDYFRGIYFSYVSLTTIGLGDYVAGVSSDHYGDSYYSWDVVLMLIWMIFGLGFVAMAINMLAYIMGILLMDILDSKCYQRASAKRKYRPLLDLINELNWQLVKSIPKNFSKWEDIEEFKDVLSDHPEDVTEEMLKKMFRIVIDLKETAYNQLASLSQSEIPVTPVIQKARDNLPSVISKQSTKVTYSKDLVPSSMSQSVANTGSVETSPDGTIVKTIVMESATSLNVSPVVSTTGAAEISKSERQVSDASSAAKSAEGSYDDSDAPSPSRKDDSQQQVSDKTDDTKQKDDSEDDADDRKTSGKSDKDEDRKDTE